MISLICIPVFCTTYLIIEYGKRDNRILKFNIPDPNYENDHSYNYKYLDSIRKDTFFKEFSYHNLKELDSTFKEFYNLQSDSVLLSNLPKNYQYGIKTKLLTTTSYKNFIQLINLCNKYKFNRFALDLRYNEFYIYDIFNTPKETLLEIHDISL